MLSISTQIDFCWWAEWYGTVLKSYKDIDTQPLSEGRRDGWRMDVEKKLGCCCFPSFVGNHLNVDANISFIANYYDRNHEGDKR